LRNLQQEFSQGRFNTEEEMILALQRFKRAFEKAKANVRGSFNENVVKSWESGVERESTAPILRKRMDTAEEGPARAAQPGARRMGPDGILREKGADGKWHPVQ
jgi:hypothetical protein